MTPPDSLRERAEKMAGKLVAERMLSLAGYPSSKTFGEIEREHADYIEAELRAVQQEAWGEARVWEEAVTEAVSSWQQIGDGGQRTRAVTDLQNAFRAKARASRAQREESKE